MGLRSIVNNNVLLLLFFGWLQWYVLKAWSARIRLEPVTLT